MKYLTLLLVTLAVTLPGQATSSFYDQGNFTAAEDEFSKRIDLSPYDSSAHYNLGNAYYKSGKLGKAIASYYRAYQINPRDSDIFFNLEFTLRKAGEELIPAGFPPVLYKAFSLLSLSELLGLHWFFVWLTLSSTGLLFILPARPSFLKITAITGTAFWAFFVFWWLARGAFDAEADAVIIKPSIEVRNGPGENFSVSFTAPEGRRLKIISSSKKWSEAGVLKEGVKGWVLNEDIALLK